jgi:hypothetical protein
MSLELLAALTHAFADELDTALSRLRHCFGQLSDEQVWWRPREDMNSIGNLVLHLTGNVKQLIVSGVGGEKDERNRPAEFAARKSVSKEELLPRLAAAVDQAKSAIVAATAEELCRVRRVNANDWTGLQAIVRSVAHFRGHTQEIIHQTREILGEKYEYAGPR